MAMRRFGIGKTAITDLDNTLDVVLALEQGADAAARAGADVFAEALRDFQQAQGYGTWADLKGITIDMKGHSRILEETGTLVENISIRRGRKKGDWEVGWFEDQPHPNSKLSLASLAHVHEFGVPKGRLKVFGKIVPGAEIPPRPWLTPVAQDPTTEDAIRTAEAAALNASLGAY